jgi:hypothetical protein
MLTSLLAARRLTKFNDENSNSSNETEAEKETVVLGHLKRL